MEEFNMKNLATISAGFLTAMHLAAAIAVTARGDGIVYTIYYVAATAILALITYTVAKIDL